MEANLVRLIILFIACFIVWVCIRIVWVCIRRVLFRDKKINKEAVLNKKEAALIKKEAAKKLFNEIKAENKKIATAQEELKKANQRGLNDITGWKFSCIKCNKAVYIRCDNCACTKFKELTTPQYLSRRLECVKCKETIDNFSHVCKKEGPLTKTSFDKLRERFSKIDSKPRLARYTDQ